MKVEARVKAEQGVSPWLLWVLLRLILCILRRSCKTQQGWLADQPNDASKQTVLLLSIQVRGGARHPVPGVLVGTGGTELVALLWGTCRVPSCCCWGQCDALKHGLGPAPHSCSQKHLSPFLHLLPWGGFHAEHPLTGEAMLGVSGTVVWVLPWVSPTLAAPQPASPPPDSACFTILLDTNCVFPRYSPSYSLWGCPAAPHLCPCTPGHSGDMCPPHASASP